MCVRAHMHVRARVCLPVQQSLSQQRQGESSTVMEFNQVHVVPPQQKTFTDLNSLQKLQRLLGQRCISSPEPQHRETHSL